MTESNGKPDGRRLALDLTQTDITDAYSAENGEGIAAGGSLFVNGGSVSNNKPINNGGGFRMKGGAFIESKNMPAIHDPIAAV